MKVRIPTARKNGRSGEIYGASARRPLPLGADAEVFPPAEVRDLRGRPLPVVYLPLHGFLVMIAAVYGARRQRCLPVGLVSDQRDLARPGRGNAGHGACAPLGHLAGARRLAKRPSGFGGHHDLADLRLRPSVDGGTVQCDVPRLRVRADSCRVLPSSSGIFYCRKQKFPLPAIQAMSQSQA